jgi:hypothetical protein
VVLLPEVLEQAVALARGAPDLEVGGVLSGTLARDVDGELFLEVRALLPARHAVSRPDRLTFTADTWADARAALALRGGDECLLGWFHSHPFFCRNCSPQAQRQCVFATPFLSEHDRSLHRAVFGRPFDVALLVTDRGPAGHVCSLFGWRQGMLEQRAYHVFGDAPTRPASAQATPAGDHPVNDDARVSGDAQHPFDCGSHHADATR